MKKNKFLSILILIGFAIFGFFFLRGRTDELRKILEIDFRYVIIIFILVVLHSLVKGQKFKILMDFYNIKLKFKEWWGLEVITRFWNFITPFKGGFSFRAVYLKKKYEFSYTRSVSTIGITYVVSLIFNSVLGMIVVLLSPLQPSIKQPILLFLALIFSCSILVFFLPLPVKKVNVKVFKYLIRSINEIKNMGPDHYFISKLVLNAIVIRVIMVTRIYFAFLAFGISPPLYFCIMINVFEGLSKMVSLTPMNLGFKEVIFGVGSKLFNISSVAGVLVAGFCRTVTFVWVFSAAPFFSYVLSKEFKNCKSLENFEIERLKSLQVLE